MNFCFSKNPVFTFRIIFFQILAIILLISCRENNSEESVRPVHLKTGHMIDPININTKAPALSWQIASEHPNWYQSAFEILVATSKDKLQQGVGDIWESGKVESDQSVFVKYRGKPLKSSEQYFWKVRVWDQHDQPSQWSESGMFAAGILDPGQWQGRWISFSRKGSVLPVFRHEFSVKKEVERALVHISGVGNYELFLNGNKVGDQVMAPAWTHYPERICYNTYDITDMVDDHNCFGVMLGNGFYFIPPDEDRYIKIRTDFGQVQFMLQAELFYSDGSVETIVSDETWKAKAGPVTFSSMYGGEDFDARLEPVGWKEHGYSDNTWARAVLVKPPEGTLVAQQSPPVKFMQTFDPISVKEVKPGLWVYDFGQNASAVPEIRVRGKAGGTIILKYGEQLNPDGTVNQDAIAGGRNSYFSYSTRGTGIEAWRPQFSYSGFQFIQVEGGVPVGENNPGGKPELLSLRSLHLRNSAALTGSFACSDSLFNQIYRINDWAVRSNLNHVLTDCPHREKLGWLEVSHLMAPSIMYGYDALSFYRKVSTDIRDIQSVDGMVPTTAPDYNRGQFGWNFTFAPEWGSAVVINPWYAYLWYGDTSILSDNYHNMKAWVDYLERHSKEHIVQGTLGDWCDWEVSTSGGGVSKFTSADFVSTAMLFYSTSIMVKTARIFNNSQDENRYQALAASIKKAVNDRYYNQEGGYYDRNSQAANAMALYMDLVEAKDRPKVLENLVRDLQSRRSDDPAKDHMQTAGDIGHRYLLRALSENGRHDVVNEMTSRTGKGSYGNIVNQGLTTMPETWDISTSASFNHCMLSHIMEWFQRDLVGINPDPENPGFRKVIIKPEVVGNLAWVKGSFASVYGEIVSEWQIEHGNFILRVEIPGNTTARVIVPAEKTGDVTVNGTNAADNPLVHSITGSSSEAILEIGSGEYEIRSENFAEE